ncbi:MAG TPA: PLP-dependent aminotransferase family protein [Ktedonobacteraceae bacterium]|jgi:DNA-binding transcriptional MocR family regulator
MTDTDAAQGEHGQGISLVLGHPDPATLLTPELRAVMQEVITSPRAYLGLQYGPEQGNAPLLAFLAERLARQQGSVVELSHLMVVAGSTHALDMLTRLVARPGGIVLVEAPTYADALHILRDHQVQVNAVPMDDQGLLPDALEQELVRLHRQNIPVSFLYTVPNFHNPTGRTLPTARRLQIIELARRYGFLIVEDDVYHDLFFEEPPPPGFYALAQGQQVASIGSFAKTLAPGLRLGWLLAPRELIERCVGCGTSQMGGGANPFAARIVAEYCQQGHWDTHLAHLQAVYRARRDTMLSALHQHQPPATTWTRPGGGFFLWLTLPAEVQAHDVRRLARQQGLEVAAGSGFFVQAHDGLHHLRLAYSYAAPADLARGAGILARAIGEARRGG